MTQDTHDQTTQEHHDRQSASADLFETALARVREERRRTANERDAFCAFEQKLREIQPQTTSVSVPAVQTTTRSPADTLGDVEEAYRSTVMSVPHYDVEYDESYSEHVAGEFNADIAAVLTDAPRFETHHRQAVLAAANTAIEQRERFLSALDSELSSLEETADTVRSLSEELEDIEQTSFSELSFGALEGYYTRMETLETQCTETLERRQSTLVEQRRQISLPIDAPDTAVYVYQPLPVNYPVVSMLVDLLDRIESLQASIHRAIYDQ